MWLIGAVTTGGTDWPPVRWVIAAVMLLVLVRWLRKKRFPNESQWVAVVTASLLADSRAMTA